MSMQQNLTVAYVEVDEVLLVNQDYRIMTSGISLTLPECSVGDHICIIPFMVPGDAIKLKRANSVTLDGSGHDSNLSGSGVTILRATGTNQWVET